VIRKTVFLLMTGIAISSFSLILGLFNLIDEMTMLKTNMVGMSMVFASLIVERILAKHR